MSAPINIFFDDCVIECSTPEQAADIVRRLNGGKPRRVSSDAGDEGPLEESTASRRRRREQAEVAEPLRKRAPRGPRGSAKGPGHASPIYDAMVSALARTATPDLQAVARKAYDGDDSPKAVNKLRSAIRGMVAKGKLKSLASGGWEATGK